MVQHVNRAFDKRDVALRVDVGERPPDRFGVVLHVYVFVKNDNALGKHHLAQAPKRVHDFERMAGVALLDADQC